MNEQENLRGSSFLWDGTTKKEDKEESIITQVTQQLDPFVT